MTSAAKLKKCAQALLEPAAEKDERAQIAEMKFSVDYLSVFGYLAKYAIDNVDIDDIKKAVKTFQGWFGLKRDGIVGPKTLKAMEAPRCGCPDIVQAENPEHEGYVQFMKVAEANLTQWRKKGLKYYINSYVRGLSQSEQQGVIAGAWRAWDTVCGISVERTTSSSNADLIMDTGEGRRSNFDGPGGTLAWAYLPSGNDRQLLMRFDLGETWITDPRQRGILLFNVACHEFGHMLGLDHSRKQGALMAPYYNPNIAKPQWDDDIPRVQARYGPETAPPPPDPDPGGGGNNGGGDVYTLRCRDLQVEGYTLFANG